MIRKSVWLPSLQAWSVKTKMDKCPLDIGISPKQVPDEPLRPLFCQDQPCSLTHLEYHDRNQTCLILSSLAFQCPSMCPWVFDFRHCSDVNMAFTLAMPSIQASSRESVLQNKSVAEGFLFSSTSFVIRLLIRPTGSTRGTSRPYLESWHHTYDEQSITTGPMQSQW